MAKYKKRKDRLCIVKECGKKYFALGYCRLHHARFKRNGTVQSIYQIDNSEVPDKIKDKRPGARGTLAVNIINDIKFKAKKRGKYWYLTNAETFQLIIKECFYCGHIPIWPKNRNGIDRVDNEKGYEINNCVSCCFTCNSAKKEMSVEQFKIWIRQIYKHFIKK